MKQHLLDLRNKSFFLLEKHFNIHITPSHFNSPIPTVYKLGNEVFVKDLGTKGLEWNVQEQLGALASIYPKYLHEFKPVPNTGLSLVDAFVLYATIREEKPKKMVEIGSGESTLIALLALKKNIEEGHESTLLSIEPYPPAKLKSIRDRYFTLIQKDLQEVGLKTISNADLLFIDSTHISKIDSDVNYQMLQIVPSLKKGALIHWHDIFIPHNYPKDFVKSGKFWNESYMLHAFLLYNHAYKIIWASHFMQSNYEDLIARTFSFYLKKHRLSSFWVRKEID